MTRAHALTASAATADRARDAKWLTILTGIIAVFVVAAFVPGVLAALVGAAS